jgi:hypothetical protein
MLYGQIEEEKDLTGTLETEVLRTGGGVGGITQEELEEALETKVDKTNGALKIYGTDANGNQVAWDYRYANNTKNTVAGRDGNGNIQVGLAKYASDAVNKEYAENNFVGKQVAEFDSGATRGYVYFIDPDNKTIIKKVQIQANPDTIPLRNPNGTFYVGNATLPYEAVNKGYVDGLVSGLTGLKLAVVDTLPTENISESTIYLVAVDGSTNNVYDEYLYINGVWEKIGSTQVEVDLTDYVKKTDYATNEVGGTLRGVAAFGFQVDTYGRGQIVSANNSEIDAKASEFKPIVPKNLDYSIVQGLTNNSITLTEEQLDKAQRWLGLDAINTALDSILGV